MSNPQGEIYEKTTIVYAYDCPQCGKHIENLSKRQVEANVAQHKVTHEWKAKKNQ